MVIIVIDVLTEKIYKFKANDKNVNFPNHFCLGSIFIKLEAKEVSLKGNAYDFSVDYDAIDKSNILNIRKYLVLKNNIKQCAGLLKTCLLYK